MGRWSRDGSAAECGIRCELCAWSAWVATKPAANAAFGGVSVARRRWAATEPGVNAASGCGVVAHPRSRPGPKLQPRDATLAECRIRPHLRRQGGSAHATHVPAPRPVLLR